jgi:signal transduction histidine kinase
MTSRISEGDLGVSVNISTGDEFERLGEAFNSMAKRLSRGREVLEEKITQATHELAEANRELKSLDKLKSDFLANMSHELRSPLTVLRGGVDYLRRTDVEPENRDYLTIMDKNLSRLIYLVSDLFDFTKIEANKIEWSFQRENVSGLVQEVIEITSPIAMDKYISISYEYPGDVFAEIDLERIEQVLVNLMENAVKFSYPGTEIRIEVREEGNDVLVAVKDQGIGISRENLEIIFEKFHTLPSSGDQHKSGGTGLGLAICKGIIHGHGGRIWVESTTGEGSIFFFSLPKQCS